MSWRWINNWLGTLLLTHVPKAFCVYSFLASYGIWKVTSYVHKNWFYRIRRNDQDKVHSVLRLRPTLPRSCWELHGQRVGGEMGSRKTCLRSSSLWQGAQTSDLHPFLPSTKTTPFSSVVILMPSNFSTCSGFLLLAWSSVPWPIIEYTQHPLHTLVHPLEEMFIFLPREHTNILCLPSVGHLDAMASGCCTTNSNCLDMYYPLKILGRKQSFQLSLRLLQNVSTKIGHEHLKKKLEDETELSVKRLQSGLRDTL